MSEFNRWVAPLKRTISEKTPRGSTIEYEDFPTTIDVTGPLLYTLMQENWHRVQIGHVVEGGVLELEFTEAPKICLIYDGYGASHICKNIATRLGVIKNEKSRKKYGPRCFLSIFYNFCLLPLASCLKATTFWFFSKLRCSLVI